ncbi:hypothetical protein ABW636_13340 [Aquimarina sp. 2201CG1-2-11]|uniref:hypothetical protein n=1 Tax=Aquimarina discodermiae TaxID=3231043 RepID=UPI003462FD76
MKKLKLFTPIAMILLLGSCEKDQLNTNDEPVESNENIKEIDELYSAKSSNRPFLIGHSFQGSPGWVRSGDFNGDGRDDIISPGGQTMHIKQSTGSGFVSKQHTTTHRWGGSGYT